MMEKFDFFKVSVPKNQEVDTFLDMQRGTEKIFELRN